MRWGLIGSRTGQDGSFVARLGDVCRLHRGDLCPCLAGAPQHPTDLAQMNLRGVEQEKKGGGKGGGGRGRGKKSMKSKEMREKRRNMIHE